MSHVITLVSGDGIGPEVTDAVVRILHASGVSIDWERHAAGELAVKQSGHPLPDELLDSIRRNKVALKGPVTTPVGEGFTSVNVGLRKALDLYANLRPVWNLPGVRAIFSDVDLVIVRYSPERSQDRRLHIWTAPLGCSTPVADWQTGPALFAVQR